MAVVEGGDAGDLPRAEFEQQGRALIQWVADYLEHPERFPVLSTVRPT